MSDEWRAETDKLHTRINEVRDEVGECKTGIAVNGTKLDDIRGDIKAGNAMRVVDRRGLWGIGVALIGATVALVRSFWQ